MSSTSSAGERHDQSEPFLSHTGSEHVEEPVTKDGDVLTAGQAWRLYLSHSLSMWNSRAYEYGAILFIQAAFPGNLLPSSINGIAETLCVLVSSSYLGLWIDRSSTRLRPLVLTIFVNRITLVVCCILWILLFYSTQDPTRRILFAIILLLGMAEKASRMTNTLSMERDWIPILANTEGRSYNLTHLNTAMRRIDIACKFTAPLTISSVVAVVGPTSAMATIAIVSSVSVAVESWIVLSVWRNNHRLQSGKDHKQRDQSRNLTSWNRPDAAGIMQILLNKGFEVLRSLRHVAQANVSGLRYYFSTTVWLPSICVAVMHASTLAWSGTLITWLLNTHFSLTEVKIAKGVGSVFEIGSTLLFPWAVSMLLRRGSGEQTASYQMVEQCSSRDDDGESSSHHHEDPSDKSDANSAEYVELLGDRDLHRAVITVASLSINALSVCLAPTIVALFVLNRTINATSTNTTPEKGPSSPLSTSNATATPAITFLSFLSLSFLVRWTYDLAVTQMTQMLVPATHRATFGGTEQAIVSVASLVHWIAAAVWHQQEDFVWLAQASVIAIVTATTGYAVWSWRMSSEWG